MHSHTRRLLLTSLLTLSIPGMVIAESFRVGVIVPLTGITSDYGESVRNSIELARFDRKDLLERVEFYYEDAAYDPKQAVSAFQKLVQVDHVDLVYVWGLSFCKAVAPLAEASQVPLVGQCIDPEVARNRTYVLRFMNYSDQYLAATTRYLAKQGLQRLAVVLTEIPYLEEMLAALERNLAPGQSVKVIQRLQANDTDLRTVISMLRNSKAQAVGVFLSAGQISSFYRQMRDQQLDLPSFGTNFFESPTEIQAANGAMDGAIFANTEVQEAFARRYHEKFGRNSQMGFGALAYEFTLALGAVVHSNPSAKISGGSVLSGFAALPPQPGIAAGPYEFRFAPSVGRYFEFPVVIKAIRGNQLIVIK